MVQNKMWTIAFKMNISLNGQASGNKNLYENFTHKVKTRLELDKVTN